MRLIIAAGRAHRHTFGSTCGRTCPNTDLSGVTSGVLRIFTLSALSLFSQSASRQKKKTKEKEANATERHAVRPISLEPHGSGLTDQRRRMLMPIAQLKSRVFHLLRPNIGAAADVEHESARNCAQTHRESYRANDRESELGTGGPGFVIFETCKARLMYLPAPGPPCSAWQRRRCL